MTIECEAQFFGRHTGAGRYPALSAPQISHYAWAMSSTKQFAVYILASKRNGTLYVGMTSNLPQRIWQHKNETADGFTKKYGVKQLVYYELHESAESAINREKQIKEWQRAWKLRLIEEGNPEWCDLYDEIVG